jgi:hypothetical protein
MRNVLLACLLLLPACASLDVKPAAGIDTAKAMAIFVRCSRPSYQKAITDYLEARKVAVEVVTELPVEGWYLNCTAVHSWDLAFYLSDAKVTSFLDGVENGSAHYVLAGGMMSLDPDKWHKDATTVKRMLDGLYGITPPPKEKEERDTP